MNCDTDADVDGQSVVITGGSKGLGFQMANGFVERGASVVCSSRTEDSLERAVSQLPEGPGDAIAVAADVRDEADVEHLVDRAEDAYGRIDVFVNNAGVSEIGLTSGDQPPIESLPTDVWDSILETNLRGAFLCTRAALPEMLDRDSGRFIHISSGMGIEGKPNRAAYTASKFGLEGFHETLAAELDGTGVDSIVLEPGGGVDTEGFSRYLSESDRETRLDPGVIVDPAVRLAGGYGDNGDRYVATEFP